MPDRSIIKATERMCVEFQRASAGSAEEARMFLDGRDRYAPRVRAYQEGAARMAAEARIRLFQLVGEA